ncbi:hypothetical protein O181_034019 [Austropuccinia psidii MF-1]|uniref:Uncharacterized protein n=1 Tax=Austropuccinia psidii MF-1 TaxID=1389203 RepID=A0A9Q3H939_9BASI|nr:hypothetical protein [Austropuccinia psidii MF-1]
MVFSRNLKESSVNSIEKVNQNHFNHRQHRRKSSVSITSINTDSIQNNHSNLQTNPNSIQATSSTSTSTSSNLSKNKFLNQNQNQNHNLSNQSIENHLYRHHNHHHHFSNLNSSLNLTHSQIQFNNSFNPSNSISQSTLNQLQSFHQSINQLNSSSSSHLEFNQDHHLPSSNSMSNSNLIDSSPHNSFQNSNPISSSTSSISLSLSRKFIPPPLELIPKSSSFSPFSNSTSSLLSPPPSLPPPSSSLSKENWSSINLPNKPIIEVLNHQDLIQSNEEDSIIEDEERKAKEWFKSTSSLNSSPNFDENFLNKNETSSNHILSSSTTSTPNSNDKLNPIHNDHNQESEVQDVDNVVEQDLGLTIMEKIFLFAKSESTYHRVIVSQRLPELLEEVDIAEAVEYVLPLLNGLANDDEAVREALGPSLCNIMWYYFSRCPLAEFSNSITDQPHHQNPSTSSTDPPKSCPTDHPRKRPQITLGSFASPMLSLLTDINRSINSFARYGLLTFLCRLTESPMPNWSDELLMISTESFLPIESSGIQDGKLYEEYIFDQPLRERIASELFSLIISSLCPPKSITTHTHPILRDSSGSDEWHTVPLMNEETEVEKRNVEIDSLESTANGLSAKILIDESPRKDNAMIDKSHHSNPNLKIMDGPDFSNQHLDQQIGLILIESVVQAGCFKSDYIRTNLLPQVMQVKSNQDSQIIRQQAASALTTIMNSLPSTLSPQTTSHSTRLNKLLDQHSERSLIDCFSQFSFDSDPEVRKQICLGLPALLKLLENHPRPQLSLEFLEHFARDDNRQVRMVACQILGELIYIFHLEKSKVPDRFLLYFLNGFTSEEPEGIGSWMGSQFKPFCPSVTLDSPNSLIATTHFDHSHTSNNNFLHNLSSFDSLGHPTEETEHAMCCAYNFPAVLLSLGVDRWQELREMFLRLAMDISYPIKIRKSLACSLHEVIKLITKSSARDGVIDTLNEQQSNTMALEDWSTVLRFFLFEDPDLENVEIVFDNLEISLNCLEPKSKVIDILDQFMSYFEASETGRSNRKVSWKVREKVQVLLPKLLGKLVKLYEKDCERVFGALLFSGLKDSVSAVREAALEFFPILYNCDRTERYGYALKLLKSLKDLSRDVNYRVRMIYPRALLNLVKLPISIRLLESIVFEEKLVEMCNDKAAGVRIGLSRLVQELCSSKNYYGPESGRRIPKLIKKMIERLSKDEELVVCSLVENLLSAQDKDDGRFQGDGIDEGQIGEEDSGRNETDKLIRACRMIRSLESMTTISEGGGGHKTESLDDEDDDDLSGSGIQVFGHRLSEDEGEEVNMGEGSSFQTEDNLQLQVQNNAAVDVGFFSPDSLTSSINCEDFKIHPQEKQHSFGCASSIVDLSPERLEDNQADDHLVQRFNEYTLTNKEDMTSNMIPKKLYENDLNKSCSHYALPTIDSISEIESEVSMPCRSPSKSPPSRIRSLWTFKVEEPNEQYNQTKPRLSTGLNEKLMDYSKGNDRGGILMKDWSNRNNNCGNEKVGNLSFSSPARRIGSHQSFSNNEAYYSHNNIHNGGNSLLHRTPHHLRAPVGMNNLGSTGGNGGGEALWMRETDGGFVEVGEY